MPGVVVREDESFENALRRFKKQLPKSGVLGEAKRRPAYDEPSTKKRIPLGSQEAFRRASQNAAHEADGSRVGPRSCS